MGFPTKIQTIRRKSSEQWYINFPAALAQACEFEYGEMAEWILQDRYTLTLRRTGVLDQTPQKKKRQRKESS